LKEIPWNHRQIEKTAPFEPYWHIKPNDFQGKFPIDGIFGGMDHLAGDSRKNGLDHSRRNDSGMAKTALLACWECGEVIADSPRGG
jgi:hypothetical protein